MISNFSSICNLSPSFPYSQVPEVRLGGVALVLDLNTILRNIPQNTQGKDIPIYFQMLLLHDLWIIWLNFQSSGAGEQSQFSGNKIGHNQGMPSDQRSSFTPFTSIH